MLEMEYAMLLDYAMEMVIIFSSNGKIEYANRTAKSTLGYEDEVCFPRISDIFPVHMKKIEEKVIIGVPTNGALCDLSAYRKNQTYFPVKARIREVDATGQLYCCTAYDATEQDLLQKKLKKVSDEALKADKVKSEFVAKVTHELRTPVNGIIANTQKLMSMEQPKEYQEHLDMIAHSCKNMNGIINNILDFSKLEAGKFTLEEKSFDLYNMMSYIKKNYMLQMTEKGLTFSMTIAPQVPRIVVGDELRIQQIIGNLLSNALKFTSVGGVSIDLIKSYEVDNQVELFFMIADSGIGMSLEEQDKLFKSFSQVDETISRKYGGTGLGLTICKQLVTLMKGKISVESHKNKGTMFSFSIWVKNPQKEEAKEERQRTEDCEQTKKNIYEKQMSKYEQMDAQISSIKQFASKENQAELEKNMTKLILSVEMENWHKAEKFMTAIRELTEEAPKEVKNQVLRLKMSVQKEDYDKTKEKHTELKELLKL